MKKIADFDGFYKLTYQADSGHELFVSFTNAYLAFCDGVMAGVDMAGFVWFGEFKLSGESKLVGKVTVDPVYPKPGTTQYTPDGNFTLEAQTYVVTLQITEVDDVLVLSGNVQHGQIAYEVSLRRVSRL